MTVCKRENDFVPLPSEDRLLYSGRLADLWSEIRCGEAVWSSDFWTLKLAPPSGRARSDALRRLNYCRIPFRLNQHTNKTNPAAISAAENLKRLN